jgi:hypothetical protein
MAGDAFDLFGDVINASGDAEMKLRNEHRQ